MSETSTTGRFDTLRSAPTPDPESPPVPTESGRTSSGPTGPVPTHRRRTGRPWTPLWILVGVVNQDLESPSNIVRMSVRVATVLDPVRVLKRTGPFPDESVGPVTPSHLTPRGTGGDEFISSTSFDRSGNLSASVKLSGVSVLNKLINK